MTPTDWNETPTDWNVTPTDWNATPTDWNVTPTDWNVTPTDWNETPTYDGHVEEAQVALDPLRREEDGAVQLGRQGHGDARFGRVGAGPRPVQARVVHLVMHVPGDRDGRGRSG